MSAVPRSSGLPPEFRRFWSGEAVSGFGNAITSLALPTLVVVTLRGDSVQVGILNSVRWLPYLVLGLIVGALIERTRRRPVMIATDLFRAGLLASIPLAWAFDLLTFPTLAIIVVCYGTASLINDAASQSFVPRLVSRTHLQRAHARLDGADAVAQTAGRAVAGALIRIVGAPLSVLIDAATYLFSAGMVATLKNVPEPPPTAASRLGVRVLAAEIREGAGWVYGRSGLRRLAVATHVWFAVQAVLQVVIVPYAYLRLQISPFHLGLVFAVAGIGALIGAISSTAVGRRLFTGGAIIFSNALSMIGVVIMLLAGLAPHDWSAVCLLALGQLCHGYAMGISNSHEMSYRQSLTPDGLQARTNTTMRSLNRAVVVIVSPVAGLIADRVGFGLALACAATIFATSALLLALSPFRRARLD